MIAMGAETSLLNRMLGRGLHRRSAVSHALHPCGNSGYDLLMAPKLSTAADSANVETSVRTQQQRYQQHRSDRAKH
jgi:hypothetical protein